MVVRTSCGKVDKEVIEREGGASSALDFILVFVFELVEDIYIQRRNIADLLASMSEQQTWDILLIGRVLDANEPRRACRNQAVVYSFDMNTDRWP